MSDRRELNRGYGEDCFKLQRMIAQTGYVLCVVEVEEFWYWYSELGCAGWLGIPKNQDEVDNIVEDHLIEFWRSI